MIRYPFCVLAKKGDTLSTPLKILQQVSRLDSGIVFFVPPRDICSNVCFKELTNQPTKRAQNLYF